MYIIIIFSILFVVVYVLFSISWKVHKDMVTTNISLSTYRYGTFKEVLEKYRQYHWYKEKYSRRGLSHFVRNDIGVNICQIHASIIQFEGEGIVLYPISYIKFSIYNFFGWLPNPNKSERLIENRDKQIDKLLR